MSMNSYPIALEGVVADYEIRAADDQRALVDRAIAACTAGSKQLSFHVLRRPAQPYATKATESLAMAIERTPIQSSELGGVRVLGRDVLSRHTPAIKKVTLDDGKTGCLLYLFDDGSCLAGLDQDDTGFIHFFTLPIALSDELQSTCGPINEHTLEKADPRVINDLAVELVGLFVMLRAEAPRYDTSTVPVPDVRPGLGHKWVDDGVFSLPVIDGDPKYFSSDQLGWMRRGHPTHYDAHLPYLGATPEQIVALDMVWWAAAAYAWRQSGFERTGIDGKLIFEFANPRWSFKPRIQLVGQGDPLSEASGLRPMWLSFISTLTDCLSTACRSVTPYGYFYLYQENTVGAWHPVILSPILLSESLDVDTSTEGLSSYLQFALGRMRRVGL